MECLTKYMSELVTKWSQTPMSHVSLLSMGPDRRGRVRGCSKCLEIMKN